MATDSPAYDQITGTVTHGYVSGATVFADANHNGQLDAGEASAITNALGQYFLQNASGPIISIGGVDTSTKQPITVQLEAPAGSTIISPLTTLINSLLPQNATSADISAAENTVAKGFGITLSPGQSLLTLDTVAGTVAGDAGATDAYLAASKVYDTITVLSAGLSNQGGVSVQTATSSIVSAIADKISTAAASGQSVDLNSTSSVQQILTAGASTAGTSVSTSAAASISNIAVASNVAMDNAVANATSGQGIFLASSAVQQVAEGATTQAILTNPPGQSLTTVEQQHTGSALDTSVTDAKGQVSTPAESATSGKILINLSGDQFQGNPEFSVYVDGRYVTGQLSAVGGSGASTDTGVSASHSQGQWQTFTVDGVYDSTTTHTIGINFNNDAYGGSDTADRNLYIGNITIAGQPVIGTTDNTPAELARNGGESFQTSAYGTVQPLTTGTDTLTLQLSGDQFAGNPNFLVYVDGNLANGQLSGIGGSGSSSDTSISADHAQNQWQTYTIKGNFDPTKGHQVQVVYNNNLENDGTSQDRNLYVGKIALNGQAITGSTNDYPTALDQNGVQAFNIPAAGTAQPTVGADKLTIHFSGDQFVGNPTFWVYVDGQAVSGQLSGVGDVGTSAAVGVSASHAANQWQTLTVTGNFDPTVAHKIDINFDNDLYAGTSSTDRNLYIGNITLNGQSVSGTSDGTPGTLTNNGTLSFTSTASAVGSDTLTGGNGGTGGAGSDTIASGQSHSTIAGGLGNLYIGTGGDTLYGGLTTGAHDTLTAGAGDNLLSVKYGDNILYANSGLDTLQGGSGHDTLYGGGSSALFAGSGGDTLYGGLTAGAHDTLTSGAGNDFLWVSQGNNVLFGGAGLDTPH